MSRVEHVLSSSGERGLDLGLLREVLSNQVSDWLDGRRFYIHELVEMRGIVRDILGTTGGDLRDGLSPAIKQLHCAGFESLPPEVLHSSLLGALKFVGIDEVSGAGLLGSVGWANLLRQIDSMCGRGSQGVAKRSEVFVCADDHHYAKEVHSLILLARNALREAKDNIDGIGNPALRQELGTLLASETKMEADDLVGRSW